MAELDQPPKPPPADTVKRGFQPGNRFGRGRPKGAENRFGPGFRERLLAGISRAGTKKAKKAGVNSKVDGIEYYLEHLAETNGAATAAIISKLIPPESPPEKAVDTLVVNVLPIEHGQHFGPGNEVLLPGEECTRAWTAFRGGPEAWKVYLTTIESLLTESAFDKLSILEAPAPERHLAPSEPKPPASSANVVRLLSQPTSIVDQPGLEPSPTELERQLLNLSHEQLLSLAEKLNVGR